MNNLQKIARNINAMDTEYEYIDGDMNAYNFWRDLRTKLIDIVRNLSESEKAELVTMCKENKAKYFNLI